MPHLHADTRINERIGKLRLYTTRIDACTETQRLWQKSRVRNVTLVLAGSVLAQTASPNRHKALQYDVQEILLAPVTE